jgi:hypothetical protein
VDSSGITLVSIAQDDYAASGTCDAAAAAARASASSASSKRLATLPLLLSL